MYVCIHNLKYNFVLHQDNINPQKGLPIMICHRLYQYILTLYKVSIHSKDLYIQHQLILEPPP